MPTCKVNKEIGWSGMWIVKMWAEGTGSGRFPVAVCGVSDIQNSSFPAREWLLVSESKWYVGELIVIQSWGIISCATAFIVCVCDYEINQEQSAGR
jgi:hypothetical protein